MCAVGNGNNTKEAMQLFVAISKIRQNPFKEFNLKFDAPYVRPRGAMKRV